MKALWSSLANAYPWSSAPNSFGQASPNGDDYALWVAFSIIGQQTFQPSPRSSCSRYCKPRRTQNTVGGERGRAPSHAQTPDGQTPDGSRLQVCKQARAWDTPLRRTLIWARARSRRLAPIFMNKATVQYGTNCPGTASGIAPPGAVRTVALYV